MHLVGTVQTNIDLIAVWDGCKGGLSITRKMEEHSIYSGILMLSLLLIILELEVRGDQNCPWGKYGDACDKNCSDHCRKSPDLGIIHCDRTSGSCSEGCIPGWYDAKCRKECSKNCINNTCNHQDGVCTLGCIAGKKGTFCEVSEEENEPKVTESTTDPWKNPTPVLITVMVVITLVILISVVIGYVCLHQKCARRQDLIADVESDGLITGKTRTRIADTTFHRACQIGDLDRVKELMSNNSIDVNAQESYGVTPVMWAAQNGHSEVFQFLVSVGADLLLLDSDGDNMLTMACVGGHVDIVKSILTMSSAPNINRPRKDGRTPLMWAALQGNLEVFNYLTSENADLFLSDNDEQNILHCACRGGHTGIVNEVISKTRIDINSSDRYGRTAMMVAAEHGHKDVFDLLVENSSDISHTDKRGKNILHVACLGGHVDMVECVLSEGAFDINCREKYGITPLMCAAFNGHRDVFAFLKGKNADASLLSHTGKNILHVACMGGHLGMVQHILSMVTVDINSQGQDGRTPLMLATQREQRAVFDLLVQKGADLSQVNKKGNNVLHLASKIGSMEIVQHVLRENTLDINAKNRRGKTAAMIAKHKGKNAVYKVLRKKCEEEE
ncbi:ankyrin repeat domain-containing protein 50-like isoform X1 [Haliotis rufescens]|uniref:ankyrin repeat domain-containing protein 50-like isoform X1 n=1 Tax=Haliotis rufescens TaxID=6454 RepID=UPI00201F283B|nr:ankyrin repeat domain-containing protein 50-like isoform X1 [Haliotis rufescens]